MGNTRLIQPALLHLVAENLLRHFGQVADAGIQLLQFSIAHLAVELGQPLPIRDCVFVHGEQYSGSMPRRLQMRLPLTLDAASVLAGSRRDVVRRSSTLAFMEVLYGLHPVEEALKAGRRRFDPVSYTHLDVYKRQASSTALPARRSLDSTV